MAKYIVKFEAEIEVDMPDINVGGESGTVVYDESRVDGFLNKKEYDEIVSKAMNMMFDFDDSVVEIVRGED